MLRQSYMNKYKKKSKYGEEKFLKEDDAYLLKESRPIKENAIRQLNKNTMHEFIDDVLTNKKLTSVLYASNAKIEIKTYLKTKKNFLCKKDEIEQKMKEKYEPSSVVKRRSRKEAYIQMRKEIDDFRLTKENYKRCLTESNNKKIKSIRDELKTEKKERFSKLKTNYKIGFERAFTGITEKLDYIKLPDKSLADELDEMRYLRNRIGRVPKIHFPEPKIEISNVYSRLYNNEVLPSTAKNVLLKRKSFTALNTVTSENMKKKIIDFSLKNALKSNNGKEFITKITKNTKNKCYYRYSGGPQTTKYKKLIIEDKKGNDRNIGYSVDYYSLVDKKTGNTFLHMAASGNYPEIVKYFIEKGANINMKNNNGNTPLHLAAKKKNKDIIKLLLNNNAALDIPNNEGEIPFDYFTPEMKIEFGIDKLLIINPAKKK